MAKNKIKETDFERAFWLSAIGVSSFVIGLGIDRFSEMHNINPLIMIGAGFFIVLIAVSLNKVRTPTSIGRKR